MPRVNKSHEMCGSDEWRAVVRESMLPWAIGEIDLGDEVLEVGPGYGATTDVLGENVARLTAVEIDPALVGFLTARFAENGAVVIALGDATALDFPDGWFSGAVSFTMLHHVATIELQDRLFAEVGRVLSAGAAFIAGDSLASPELEALHGGDIYNPVNLDELPDRLEAAGFIGVKVKTNPFGWAVLARKQMVDSAPAT
jgi:SAM-dependent methyltransferase